MDRCELPQEVVDEFVRREHGDLDGVRQMVRAHPELVNACSSAGETPLRAAAHVGHKEIAAYLVSEGAELGICAAAMLGMDDFVRQAVEADPALANARGAHGIPILFHAAIGSDHELVRFLVERGSEVTLARAGGLTDDAPSPGLAPGLVDPVGPRDPPGAPTGPAVRDRARARGARR
ncbi:MAG: ankyrin repeat domain-containing protein [Armatimonadota bacterium]|nr:ankyrin repeat domain-containing protein [Armatimonadota bacterium]MDR5696527.1 ankyrin repeat domain-containing protein [Armatimonadota bacterium]